MQWSQQLEEISCMCIHSVLTVSWGFTEYCASPLEAEGAKICNQTLLFISVSPAWQVSLVAHKVKNLPTNAGDAGSIPQLGRSPGEGNGNPLQYSCLGNPVDRGTWWSTVQRIARVGYNLATKQQWSDLGTLGRDKVDST